MLASRHLSRHVARRWPSQVAVTTGHRWRPCPARPLTSVTSAYRTAQTPSTGQFTPSSTQNWVQSIYPRVDIPHGNAPLHSFVLGEMDEESARKVAISDALSGQKKTFGQLQDEVRKFGSYLARNGLGRHQVVALHLPNTPDYAVAFLGTLAAGAVVSTMNPVYTVPEIGRQLADSDTKVLVTHATLVDSASKAAHEQGLKSVLAIGATGRQTVNGVEVIPFDDYLHDDGSALPEVVYDVSNDIAVLPYSSGTTGLPKGVELTHRNIIANLLQLSASPEILCLARRPKECIVCVLPFFHIYGMVVLLLSGIYQRTRLVTLPKFEPASFLDTLQREKATQLFVAPPLVVFLAKHPMVDQYDLSSIYSIFSGAAPLGGNVTEEVSRRLGCNVLQGYGLTELSPVCHVTPFSSPRHGSVGLTVPNTEVSIVDVKEDGRAHLLSTGQTGEICVRGPQVMRGYLNQPAATAATVDADGWLHTGDIGYHDSDGYLFVTDRLKELIKRKGFQVPPAELERELLEHPEIVDCAVIGVPDDKEGELPRAYVVLKEGSGLTEDGVQSFMADRVAPYKQLDGGVVFTQTIPKSASGKILRRELRAQVA